MIMLWIRDIKRESQHILIKLGIAWFVPLIILILFKFINVEKLYTGVARIFTLPPAIYGLLGFSQPVSVEENVFYIAFVLMFINAWVLWDCCVWTMRIMRVDERTGNMLNMCNQLYNRTQLALSKYIETVGGAFIYYIVWYAGMLLLIRISGSGSLPQNLILLGAMVCILFASITYVYTVYSSKRTIQGMFGFRFLLIGGTWILGNLYKVCNLLILAAEKQEKPTETIQRIADLLKKLYWISPLSWLNPYVQRSAGVLRVQIIICLVAAIACAGLGLWGYQKRDFS